MAPPKKVRTDQATRYLPKEDKAKLIAVLAAIGTDELTICRIACIPTVNVLGRDYGYALERGRFEVSALIGKRVVQQALAGNMPAAFFYLKHKGGWIEQIRHTGHDGGPLTLDVRALSTEQLLGLQAAGRAAGLDGPGSDGAESSGEDEDIS